jgi:ASC-1-like (ASCH) protein
MKNIYLNSVLISRFYLQIIHKTKNTKKIIITKIKKSKKNTKIKKGEYIPFNMLKTTIKTIKIHTNSCKNKTQTERRREDEMRNEEKMNHGGGVAGFYTTILPTALPK